MKFKKDYINFLIRKTVYESNAGFRESLRLKNIAEKVTTVDDVGKLIYLVGKTAGLESLFKYLLYISDKIDKSQVSIFNLKDNIDYDLNNLKKICQAIIEYNAQKDEQSIGDISDAGLEAEKKQTIKIDLSEDEVSIEKAGIEKEDHEAEEPEAEEHDTGMTLIENPDAKSGEGEVFELESISETVENIDSIEEPVTDEVQSKTEHEDFDKEEVQIEESDLADRSGKEEGEVPDLQNVLEPLDTDTSDETIEAVYEEKEAEELPDEEPEEPVKEEIPVKEPVEEIAPEAGVKEFEDSPDEDFPEEIKTEIELPVPEIEIEVVKQIQSDLYSDKQEHVKEESVTNDAYYKFETKFFEEVKILEKLLATVDKQFKYNNKGKLNEKTLQSLTEIIEITSELSNLSRQLMFDLIADVFLTMNLYFTKIISTPGIFDSEKNMLFDSSLALVNSLIKGEDYLNYDVIIDKIEKLKKQLTGTEEEKFEERAEKDETAVDIVEKKIIAEEHKQPEPPEPEPEIQKPVGPDVESAQFKLKYLVKEFEKSFVGISSFKGEYSRFEALEKINELNNALRLIAKISSSIKENDVLKLAEVTYVFLKYLKDYRIDLLDAEIQQIVKYIIFTFKMLLTSRRPDDFNILVQHLNNPVKIFTDN